MAHMDVALKEMMLLDGALGAAVVDYDSGMPLDVAGSSRIVNIEVAAAGSTELIRAKLRTIEQLGLEQEIEDVLVTLSRHHHLIRPATGPQSTGLFFFLVLDRDRGNLALARHRLKNIAAHLEI